MLLNADAQAEPGAVRALLRATRGYRPPYAVMARPVVPAGEGGPWKGMLELMWDLHHLFHRQLQDEGGGFHLSDEMMLLSLDPPPDLPEGIINDGSYLAVWLAQHRGARLYADDARVRVEIPQRMRDHLRQRRRIRFGNAQVSATLGAPPSTLTRYALGRPGTTLALVRRSIRHRQNGWMRLAALGGAEAAAEFLALWDRVPPARDHVRWHRIASGEEEGGRSEAPTLPAPRSDGGVEVASLAERVASLVEVAGRFGTGLPLRDFVRLLPPSAPPTEEEAARWVDAHPEVGKVVNGRVMPRDAAFLPSEERSVRGARYLHLARALFERELAPVRPWVRAAAVTGSTAYGEPDEDDDLDLFVVTRSGALWAFLIFAYLRLRRSGRRAPAGPALCFNYVLDDRSAPLEFAHHQGFLFAREALVARPVLGEEYYRHLLGGGAWMAGEIPRLYAERAGPGPAEPSLRAPPAVRLLNAALWPWAATYLQLAGLRRNHRLAREGRHAAEFGTRTDLRGLCFGSRRFESLRALYEPGPADGSTAVGAARSKLPTLR